MISIDRTGPQMIGKRVTAAALAACAAVPLALLATPGSASASGTDYLWAYWQKPGSTTSGGYGVFHSYGEIVQVQDWHADGWRTWAQIQTLLPDSSGVLHWKNYSSACWDDTSHGDTSGGGFTTCNYSLPEGTPVRIHVWATNSGEHKYDEYSPGGTA
jgi:hypothetical protein